LFIDDFWPDVDESTIDYIISEYSKRHRRFGGK
jgi:undecaprenyl pyrophosphate synthase